MTSDDTSPPQTFPRAPGDCDLGGFIGGLVGGRKIAIALGGERWGVAACEMIARMDQTLDFDLLSVRGSPLGDPGVAALAAGNAFRGIGALSIERCGLSDVGVAALLRSGPLGRLKSLSLCNRDGIGTGPINQIGDISAMALATTPNCPVLEELDVWNTQVGDAGFAAIANSDQLPLLDGVHAWGTRLTAHGAAQIKDVAAARSRARDLLGLKPIRWTTYHTDHDQRTVSWTDDFS